MGIDRADRRRRSHCRSRRLLAAAVLGASTLAASYAFGALGPPSAQATATRRGVALSFGEIRVVGVDGRRLHSLTPPGQFDGFPVFTPDGRRLVFLNYGRRVAGPPRALLMSLDGKQRTRFLPNVKRTIGEPFVWSADGRHIALSIVTPSGARLAMAEISSGRVRPLSQGVPCGWSPSGLFAYTDVTDVRATALSVVVTNAAGRRLWSRPGTCAPGGWARGGGRIAIMRHGGQTPSGLPRGGWVEIADAFGKTLRVFSGRNPVWSPDGRKLAFVRGQPETLWLTRVPGTGARRIAAQGNGAWSAPGLWSPDSRRLAYSIDAVGPRAGLYVITLNGQVLRHTGASGGYPRAWVSEQRLLVSRDYGGRTAELAVIPIRVGATKVLDRFKVDHNRQLQGAALSPDRRTVAYNIATR